MGVRSFLKDFWEVVDEGLRQKTVLDQKAVQEAPGSQGSALHPPSSQEAMQSGRELNPFALERGQLETERATLEIGQDIRLFLSPTNIQIDSPFRLEEAVLQPFRLKQKQILLLNTKQGKVVPATLHSVDD